MRSFEFDVSWCLHLLIVACAGLLVGSIRACASVRITESNHTDALNEERQHTLADGSGACLSGLQWLLLKKHACFSGRVPFFYVFLQTITKNNAN